MVRILLASILILAAHAHARESGRSDYVLHGLLSERREPGRRDCALIMALENIRNGENEWVGRESIIKSRRPSSDQ